MNYTLLAIVDVESGVKDGSLYILDAVARAKPKEWDSQRIGLRAKDFGGYMYEDPLSGADI